jgi:spoIIIJ-associated protein
MEKIETLKNTTKEILKFIGVNPEVEITDDKEYVNINIKGDNLNFLIGYRGQSLDAFQSLVAHITYKKIGEWPTIMLDINGYNEQRIERLHNIAKKFIDRVRFFQNEVELPLMSPWERRQIHTLISDYDDVVSESRGDGKNRRLYLRPKQAK